MNGILDFVARSRTPAPRQQFLPSLPQQFFALRLAQRMNDGPAAQHYVELCDAHSEGALLTAYRRALASGAKDLTRAFHAALPTVGRYTNGFPERDLAAIRIERRAVAVAIFQGTELKYPPITHQLSSDPNKAVGSAASFMCRIWDKCSFPNAAFEVLPSDCEAQRSQLARTLTEVLTQRQVAIWRFAKKDVLAAFAHPPLRFRNQVREVVSAIWPDVEAGFGAPLIKDALALGLYCQVEHLLSLEQ